MPSRAARALSALSLLLACPGPGPYRAWAQTLTAAPAAAWTPPGAGVLIVVPARIEHPAALAGVTAPRPRAFPRRRRAGNALAAAAAGSPGPRRAPRLAALFDGRKIPALSGGPVLSGEPRGPSQAPLAPKGLKAALKEMACGEPDVAPFVRPHRLQMNAARGMLVLKAVLSTAQAYSLGALVDAAIARSLPAAALWLGIMAGVAAAKALDQRFYSLESGRLRIAVRRGVRLAVFEALSRTPSPGEAPDRLAARLTADANRVVVKNVSIPIQFPHLVIQSALACAFLVKASPWMAALVLGSLPLLGALARRYGRRCARLQERACTQSAAMTQEGARLLSRAPMEGEESGRAAARYRRASDRFEGTMLEYARAGADFDGIREALQAAGTELLVLGLGLLGYILTGSPSIGQVMALRGYAKDLRGAVDGIIDAYTGSKDAEGGTRRILELLRLGRPPATEP